MLEKPITVSINTFSFLCKGINIDISQRLCYLTKSKLHYSKKPQCDQDVTVIFIIVLSFCVLLKAVYFCLLWAEQEIY